MHNLKKEKFKSRCVTPREFDEKAVFWAIAEWDEYAFYKYAMKGSFVIITLLFLPKSYFCADDKDS